MVHVATALILLAGAGAALAAVSALGAPGLLGTGRDELLAGLAASLIALEILVSALLARTLRGQPVPLAQLVLVPIKDLVVLGIWAVALVRRDITWRGHRMRIGAGSTLQPLAPQRATPARALHLCIRPARVAWRLPRRVWRVLRRPLQEAA